MFIPEQKLEQEGIARGVGRMSPSVVSETLMAEPAAEMVVKPGQSQAQDFIFRSKLPDTDLSNHMSLVDYCLEKFTQWTDKVCLIDGNTGREHTYGEIELSTRRVAAGLAKLGVKQGGVLALLLPNCAEFVQVFLGAAKLGAVVTTANPFYTSAEIEKQMVASGATLVVTQSSYIEKLSGLNVQVPNYDNLEANHDNLEANHNISSLAKFNYLTSSMPTWSLQLTLFLKRTVPFLRS